MATISTPNGLDHVSASDMDRISAFLRPSRSEDDIKRGSSFEITGAMKERVRQQETESLVDESSPMKLSPFTIRHFVATIRGSDISKSWPFRRKILDKCLSIGLQPQLPPFDPPPKCIRQGVQVNSAPVSCSCEQVVSKLSPGISEGSNGQGVSDTAAPVFSEKTLLREEDMGCVDVQVVEQELKIACVDNTEPLNHCDTGTMLYLSLDKSLGECENKQEESGETGRQTPSCLVDKHMEETKDSSDCRTAPKDALGLTLPETPKSIVHVPNHALQESKACTFDMLGTEAGFNQESDPDCSTHTNSTTTVKAQDEVKGISLSDVHTGQVVVQAQVQANDLKPLEGSTHGEISKLVEGKLQEMFITSGGQTLLDNYELVGPGKPEKSKSGDDFVIQGLNLDALTPQVCPVCLNFMSTSNTALNAHIDHCLEAVLPGEKSQEKISKGRIKPRKMRSMVDICASAPSRTLEDLELSSQQWALDETEKTSCSIGWKDGVVRRQPRTSLCRMPAWQGKDKVNKEWPLQHSPPPLKQKGLVEKLSKEYLDEAVKGPITSVNSGIEVKQQQDDWSIARPLISAHTARAREVRGKRKSGSASTSTKVFRERSASLSSEGPSVSADLTDCSWSGSLSYHGITPVDTSAEEVKRLQCEQLYFTSTQGQECEDLRMDKRKSIEVHMKGKGRTFIKFSQVAGASTRKQLSPNSKDRIESSKKWKSLQSEQVDTLRTEPGEGNLSEHEMERFGKSKRLVQKTKSLSTIATYLIDKDEEIVSEGASEEPVRQKRLRIGGLHKASPDQEGSKPTTRQFNHPPRKCLKRKRPTALKRLIVDETGDRNMDMDAHAQSYRHVSSSLLNCSHLQWDRALGDHVGVGRDCSESLQGASSQVNERHHLMSIEELESENERELKVSNISKESEDEGDEGILTGSPQRVNGEVRNNKQDNNYQACQSISDQPGCIREGLITCEKRFSSPEKTNSNAPCQPSYFVTSTDVCNERLNMAPIQKTVRTSAPLFMSSMLDCLPKGVAFCPSTSESRITTVNNVAAVPSEESLHYHSFETIRSTQVLCNASVGLESADCAIRAAQSASPWMGNSEHSIIGTRRNMAVDTAASTPQLTPSHMQVPHFKNSVSGRGAALGHQLRQSTQEALKPVPRTNLRTSTQSMGQADPTECLHKVLQAADGNDDASTINVLAQNLSDLLGSRFFSSFKNPASSCQTSIASSLQDNSKFVRAVDYVQMVNPSIQHGPFLRETWSNGPKTMPDCSRGPSGDPLCMFMETATANHYTKTVNGLSKNSLNAQASHDNIGVMQLDETPGSYHRGVGGRSIQPNILQTAMHMMNGSTDLPFGEQIQGSYDSAEEIFKPSSNTPVCGHFSAARMNGRPESLGRTTFSSRLNGYDGVGYPGEQGVVHIFGNPVFKLMGKNVMVTNKNIKALGMESRMIESVGLGFDTASSMRHSECRGLGLFEDSQSQYPHALPDPSVFMSQDTFPSPFGSWTRDFSKARSHSAMPNSGDIDTHPGQANIPFVSFNTMEHARYDCSTIKSPVSVPVLGERPRTTASAVTIQPQAHAFTAAVNSLHPGAVFDGSLSNSISPVPAILYKGGCPAIQQTDGSFPSANPLLMPIDEAHLQAVFGKRIQAESPDVLTDGQRLGIGVPNNHPGSNVHSGTLSDIVQSSERNSSRLWTTLPEPMQPRQFRPA